MMFNMYLRNSVRMPHVCVCMRACMHTCTCVCVRACTCVCDLFSSPVQYSGLPVEFHCQLSISGPSQPNLFPVRHHCKLCSVHIHVYYTILCTILYINLVQIKESIFRALTNQTEHLGTVIINQYNLSWK